VQGPELDPHHCKKKKKVINEIKFTNIMLKALLHYTYSPSKGKCITSEKNLL
jgi:hypothetical protein